MSCLLAKPQGLMQCTIRKLSGTVEKKPSLPTVYCLQSDLILICQRAVLVCHWDALQACFQVTNFVGFSRSSIRFFCRGNCSGTSLASCLQFNISQSVLDCVWLWSLNRFFPPVIFQRVVAVGARGAPWKGCSFCFRKVTTEVLS